MAAVVQAAVARSFVEVNPASAPDDGGIPCGGAEGGAHGAHEVELLLKIASSGEGEGEREVSGVRNGSNMSLVFVANLSELLLASARVKCADDQKP